jgi:predicted dehydrogenase
MEGQEPVREPIGAGVVGTGWVSGEHLRWYRADPRFRVAAICGRTVEKARQKADELGLEDVRCYDDYAKMLADPEVQAVSICTPPHLHPEQTIRAAEAGKHILIEKAVANDPASLGKMLRAVQSAGVRTVVSFVLRWNPQFILIRRMLDSGATGRIFYAEVDYWHNIGPQYPQYRWNVKKDVAGSSFLSAGCHAVDAIRFFTGDEVAEVSAYCTQVNPDYEYPPTVVGVLKFRGGAVGKVSSVLEGRFPYLFNIDLLGERGSIRDNRIWAPEFFAGSTGWVEVPTVRPDSGDVTHHPFQGEIAHFGDCILSGTESFVNLADAAKTHAVCYALDRSAAGHRPVKLEEIYDEMQ